MTIPPAEQRGDNHHFSLEPGLVPLAGSKHRMVFRPKKSVQYVTGDCFSMSAAPCPTTAPRSGRYDLEGNGWQRGQRDILIALLSLGRLRGFLGRGHHDQVSFQARLGLG